MNHDKIEATIDLLKACVRNEVGLDKVIAAEDQLSNAERCLYAFTIAAKAQGRSIEDFETHYKIDRDAIELGDETTRAKFVAAARFVFSESYRKEIIVAKAISILSSDAAAVLGVEGRSTMGAIVMAATPAVPASKLS